MKQRGKRIRPSGKDLVFHFTIASLLPVFLLVVGLFHVKTIQQINWQDFNLSQADKIDIPYLIISFSVAILICLLVAFVFKRVRYDTVKQLYHRQKLAKMILENKWYESEQVKTEGFFKDSAGRTKEKITYFPKMYYRLKNGLIQIRVEITLGKYQDQLLHLEKKLESGLYCELTDKELKDSYVEYTLLYDTIASRISIDEVEAKDGKLRLMKNVWWEYDKLPHMLIAGGTGGGKTYFILTLIEALLHTDSKLYILDPKNADLADLGSVMANVYYRKEDLIVGELDFPSSEIFYYQQQQFTFPIDTSMNVEIVANRKALSTVRNKKKELKDLDNHAWQSDNETSSNVAEALESVNELETNLDQSKESMYKLSYVVRVSANDLDELKRRCNEVKDFYDDLSVKLVRPFGDMLGLHEEFLPASKRYMNDYIQYVTSDFLAGLGFGATQMLGENEGIYVGYSLDTGRNVYLKPALASQGVKGSVTNALASAFVGSLGGGKSFANNLIVYYAVLYGAQAVIVDPKAERGRWKETLPEISHEINIVTLTSDEKNKGLLDPYVIMKNPKDSESLAIDILTFLTGISSRDGERFPILRKAIRAVTNSEVRGLMKVIEELRVENTPLSTSIADHIESFTDYDFAHLLFSNGYVEQSISLEKQLNIIQVADLVLPDKETSFEEYTTMELLSVAMLIVISTFALDFIHTDRSIFKIVDLDEAWSFLQVAQGKTLSMKLVRAGRAMNAGVYFVTQNTDDLLDEKLKNNLGLKFAFRSTDLNEIKKTLAFFGVDPEDENNQKRLRDLENGQCLISDLYGRVGVIQFHPVFEELLHAFDTRPPVRKEV